MYNFSAFPSNDLFLSGEQKLNEYIAFISKQLDTSRIFALGDSTRTKGHNVTRLHPERENVSGTTLDVSKAIPADKLSRATTILYTKKRRKKINASPAVECFLEVSRVTFNGIFRTNTILLLDIICKLRRVKKKWELNDVNG